MKDDDIAEEIFNDHKEENHDENEIIENINEI